MSSVRSTRAILVVAIVASLSNAARMSTAAQESATAEPAIRVTASQTTLRVAEPVKVTFEVTAPAEANVVFPPLESMHGEFELIDSNDLFDIPSRSSSRLHTWTREVTVDSIHTGELSIPSIEVQVLIDGDVETVRSQPLTLKVVSVLEGRTDPTEFRDIQSVVDVEVPELRSYRWIGWAAAGAAGAVVLAMAFFWIARRRSYVTPLRWAEAELNELASTVTAGAQPDSADVERLSSILREYFSLQFPIDAPFQSTHEFVAGLRSDQFVDDGVVNELEQLLSLADQSKFAGLTFTADQWLQALSRSREMIQQATAESQAMANRVGGAQS